MAYVPQYRTGPLQFTPPQSDAPSRFMGELMKMRDQRAEETRLRNKALQVSMDKLSIGELVGEANTKMANQAYNEIVGDLTNAMMYRSDGTRRRKESSFFGPQIDDMEFQEIMKKIQSADQVISELRAEEGVVKNQYKTYERELANPSGRINMNRTKAMFDSYYSGDEAFPEDGNFIVLNGRNPNLWTSEIKTTQPVTHANGYRIKPAESDEWRRAQYYNGMRDMQNQIGVAEQMLKQENQATAIQTIAANLIHDQGMDPSQAQRMAANLLGSFAQTGKVPAQMTEAVVEWGEKHGKYHENIGKREVGLTAEGAKAAEKETEEKIEKPRTISISYPLGKKKTYDIKQGFRVQSNSGKVQIPAGSTRISGGYKAGKSISEGTELSDSYVDSYDVGRDMFVVHPVNKGKITRSIVYLVPGDMKDSLNLSEDVLDKYHRSKGEKYEASYNLQGYGRVTKQQLLDAGWTEEQIKSLR